MIKEIGSNIIKLEGYGVYVTYIDDKLYVCPMQGKYGHPRLDEDKCIDWEELTDPDNQAFLNLVNRRFLTSFVMGDFGKSMKITDIRDHIKTQKEIENAKDDRSSKEAG